MKEFLEKILKQKEDKAKELRTAIKAGTNPEEVRAMGETLENVTSEITEIRSKLEEFEKTSNPETSNSTEERSFNPLAAYQQNSGQGTHNTQNNNDPLDSIEYRQAFANYVRTGQWQYTGSPIEARADATVVTANIGKLIPNTVMSELIKKLSVYGQLYSKVRKLNIQGGVEFPISELAPTVKWISETAVSETQAAPEVKSSVIFGYHIAEARVSQSLLSSVVSLSILESEIAELLAEAFIREYDYMIVNGTGVGMPTGILKDSRLISDNYVDFNATDAADWTKYRTELFAKIPLGYQRGGILICTSATWESQFMTLRDANNRPLYLETYNAGAPDAAGGVIRRFAGREVVLVEPDIIKDFDAATTGDAWAIYLKPTDYAINSNQQIGFKRYFNEDTNKWVNKGLAILDGKLLDVRGVYILRKGA